MKRLCDTRWVDRHVALQDIALLHEFLVDSLASISSGNENWDSKSVTEAHGLLTQLCSSMWIVALHVNLYFSGFLRGLSLFLLGPSQDVITAYNRVSLVVEELKSTKKSSETAFQDIWTKASAVANSVDVKLSVPQKCGKQTHRNNVVAGSAPEYFKRSVFIPYLDHLIMELGSRFSHATSIAMKTLHLLPCHVQHLQKEDEVAIENFFSGDLPLLYSFKHELILWKREWQGETSPPSTIENTLTQMIVSFYPNIAQILRLTLMLPVPAATVERAHSALKEVKTNKRSSTGSDRLSALILLHVHRDITLDLDDIIDSYARRHPRRMKLLNPLEGSLSRVALHLTV